MPSIIQTGPNSWRCTVRIKGHKPVHKTFDSEKDARHFGEQTERILRHGPAGSAKFIKRGPTVEKLCELFREVRAEGARPISERATEHYYLKNLVRLLGKKAIEEVTTDSLAAYCRRRIFEGVKPSTALEELNKLSTVIRHTSHKVGRPLPDVVNAARPHLHYSGLIGSSNERNRRPTQDELDAVCSKLEPQIADIVRFAVATAMRRSEICRVEWADLNQSTRCLLITDRKDPRKKDGNDGVIPLLSVTGYDAWEIVRRQPQTSDRIFPVYFGTVSNAFLYACRAAGVEDLHFHDLRHEGISRMFEAGMTIEEVSLVSGHKDWRNLKRYVQLKPESLHDIHRGTQQRPARPKSAGPRRGRSAAQSSPGKAG